MADSYDFNNTTNFKKVKILPLKGEKGDQGEAGISGDYSGLINKPSINSIQITGNKTASDLGIASQASVEALAENVNELAENVYTKEETISAVIDAIYPVGSIYMSANDVNPSTLFSGTTWEQIKGQFLLGHDDTIIWDASVMPPVRRERFPLGGTGGEATHTLTISEMPSHSHSTTLPISTTMPITKTTSGNTAVFEENTSANFDSESTGLGTAHNNMPPYLTVNIWQRTA